MTRLLLSLGLLMCLPAREATAKVPKELNGISFDQHLDAQVPLQAQFTDEDGKVVALGDIFHGKPVLLATVYYTCPMLCNQILSGVVRGLRPLTLAPGRDFEIVAVSINPVETPSDARAKRDFYSRQYSSRSGLKGWHFLVGQESSIKTVADAVGFHYRYDPASRMYFHASGITVLTPEGRVSRYLYGVDYEPKDLKLSLIEASHDRIGSPADQILLFCYHYDPKTGKYGMLVVNILKIVSGLLLTLLVGALVWLWRRDLRQYSAALVKAEHS